MRDTSQAVRNLLRERSPLIVLHVLFIADDTSRFINKNYHYLEQELKRFVHLTVWRKSGHIDHILNKLTKKPDFILLLNDIGQNLSPMIKGLANIHIPTGLIINDIHRLTKIRDNFITKNKINHIFTVGWEQSVQTYPHLVHKMEWLPHFVHTGIYKDYRLKRDIQLLMIGAVNDNYPVRKEVLNTFSNDSRFIYHQHPGYRNFNAKEEKRELVGEKYAREIARAQIFFTCPSIYNYPVKKYFEVLACKTLLLAPTFKELEKLGFVPGEHFVAIDEQNFKEKAEYYLAHAAERQKIAEQGYQFIHQCHTVKIRAMQLAKKIEKIV